MNATALALFAFLSTSHGHAVTPCPTVDRTGTSELTTGGLRWSHLVPTGLGEVSLGDRGGLVLARHPTTAPWQLLLLSSFDSQPPQAIWAAADVPTWFHDVAASEADVYLVADIRKRAFYTLGTLKKFTSRSSDFVWKYEFPRQAFSLPMSDVSRDGRTIVSAFANESTLTREFRIHDPATGAALQTIALPPSVALGGIDLSPDGRAVAFSSGTGTYPSSVFDIASQTVVHSALGSTPARQAISDEGRVVVVLQRSATADNHVLVFARGASGYRTAVDAATPSELSPRDAAVSDDGSTVVAAWGRFGAQHESVVRAYDVATGAMTMERVQTATGEIFPSDVAISANGSRFVVGLFQPGSASHAELAVYRRDSSQPLVEHALGGAVLEVDMAPDGKRYAGVRIPTNRGFNSSSVELYELGREDFVVRGCPTIGSTVTFELHGASGASAMVLRSFALAPNPIDVPGVGTLRLDSASIAATSMGTVPASGPAMLTVTVEQLPGMVGRTLFYQGLTTGPRSLTRDWVQLTIVP